MTEEVKEKVYNRAQDYYKMLLFLNESTNDSFLLWDMESDIVYFSRQLSVLDGREHREGIPDDIFAYDLDAINRHSDIYAKVLRSVWILISDMWINRGRNSG